MLKNNVHPVHKGSGKITENLDPIVQYPSFQPSVKYWRWWLGTPYMIGLILGGSYQTPNLISIQVGL